jgi:hypothetical protein
MILDINSQAKALARLTHTPVAYNQKLLAPVSASSGTEINPFFLGIGGDEATFTYLVSKIAANVIALSAAVRQYGYSKDNSDLADAYSKMAERRRANYDTMFKPREGTYVGIVRSEPVYNPNYVASDALASEVTVFSVYNRMRATTPELDTKQRDNFSFGINGAWADSADYGRRREENKSDRKNEDRLNILFATAQLSFNAGEAASKIAEYGTEIYTSATKMRSEFTGSIIADAVKSMSNNIDRDRGLQRRAFERSKALEVTDTRPNMGQLASVPIDWSRLPSPTRASRQGIGEGLIPQ